MKNIGCFLASIVTMSLATATMASVSLPKAWYMEGNYGRSIVHYKSSTESNGTGYGWGANIGYKLMPFLGLEAGYTKYAPLYIYGSSQITHQNYDGHLAAKFMLPLGVSGVELFAKVGAARIYSYETPISNPSAQSVKIGSTGLYYGGGLSYTVSPNWLISTQWEQARGNDDTTSSKYTGSPQFYSVGLTFLLDPAII